MTTCKGNRGNLMQHWLLCETLSRLSTGGVSHLMLTCTHAMGPKASAPVQDRHFRAALDRLPQTADRSAFEHAWSGLTNGTGLPYPNSAALASQVWSHRLSMLLCEADPDTAQELCSWLGQPDVNSRLEGKSLYPGDWRRGVASMVDRLAGVDLVYIEQDPMQYDFRDVEPRLKQSNKLFPCDVRQVLKLVEGLTIPVVLQLSSFTANGGCTHQKTRESVLQLLAPAGFQLQGEVVADGHMISLVYAARLPASIWDSLEMPQRQFEQRFPKD